MRNLDQRTNRPTHVPFDELPIAGETGMRHAWDVFGREDSHGTLNFITPERRRAALASVRTGVSIGLTLPLDRPHPSPFGRGSLQHEIRAINSYSWDDRITRLDPQSSTQWDGLLHVGHRDVGLYGGHEGPPTSQHLLGIHNWARSGIVGRAVLVDLGSWLADREPGYDATRQLVVDPGCIKTVLESQRTALEPGDILCLRFGWHDALSARTAEDQHLLLGRPECAGLAADEAMAQFLWDHQVAAVATDNPTVETQPGDREVGFLHQRLLTMLGMPLGELFDLDPLAAACRERGAWDFLFVSVPLHLPGGVGSPGNAIALI